MKKLILFITLILTFAALAQTSEFRRYFTKTNGSPLTGYTNYIYLVPQANDYPVGALTLTEDGTRPGVYYRANVPDGEYKIYIDGDRDGAGTPAIYLQHYWVGENRLSIIADNFDATDSYKLKGTGIKDGAVTESKIGTGAVTESKIGSGAVTNTKLGTNSVTTDKISPNAVESTNIKDANVTLPKLSQTVLDYINSSGGGTITNNPDDVSLETKPGSKLGIKKNQTSQLNFMGTVKFGSDTTMRLGYVENNIRTGLYIQTLPTHPYGMNRIFKSVPSDVNSGAWSLVTSTHDWQPTRPGQDIPINLGYNWDGEITAGWGAGQWGFQFEPNYEWQDTLTVYEYFLYYNNYPPPNTTYGVRPFQVGIFRGLSGYYHKRSVSIDVDELTIGKSGGTSISDAFSFRLGLQTSTVGKNYLRLTDTTTIYQTNNNIGWLFQSNSNNSATELMRLDNTNSVVLSPSNNDIKLSGQIFGSATNSAPSFGKTTTQKNYGIAFRTTGTYSGGSIHWNGDNAYFALTQGISQASGYPNDWEAIHPDNYKTSLFLGGVVLIGNKNYGNLDRGIRIGYSSTTPTGVSGTTSLYTVGQFGDAELKVMNAAGVVSQLSGDPVVGTVLPRTDNTYYIGKNSTSSPAAWKGIILKDQVNGNYYRIEMINGVLTTTNL